jgi:predicted patatin/cPLA2 family phospholipase
MSRKDFNTVLIASGSLPLVAPMVSFDGKLLLDGGLTDSIPFEYALNNGHKKAVVVLTQAKGYIKDPLKYRLLFKWVYRKYPKVYEMMLSRADNYNASIRRLEQLEKEGVLFVIRPEEKLRVSRLENKPHKTAKVYASAMELAKRKLSELQNWLGQ